MGLRAFLPWLATVVFGGLILVLVWVAAARSLWSKINARAVTFICLAVAAPLLLVFERGRPKWNASAGPTCYSAADVPVAV